ncbi:patatin-like phospholipase family protein [Aequorivita capsosiphonis]|uniref:patatin-like phospholipase family protein n=1 Tax=Aequorivita capsosiphonis TaxID=487317 RepID=UPI0003F9ECD2|nr:patatin-like phospholipase family protein [Aequorivita capsosiphonis]
MENEKSFKLCITMAGAVSAGAYTAGVMDYLIETLDLWEKAKEINRSRGVDHPDYDHSIPMHEVEIDVMSGSSAGGISSSLTLLALADKDFKSYNKDNPSGKNNIFYESWVDMADTSGSSTLDKLLKNNDLKEFGEVRSLLNTTAIDSIANEAIRIREPRKIPKYASDSLDIILTTTNLRGINFLVNFDGRGDASQGTVITNHGGFFRYKLKNDKFKAGIPESEDELYYVLDISKKKHLRYLKDATLSTAAFPIGLRSREVSISSEYIKRYPKYLFNQSKGIEPLLPEGAVYKFNSVDGGIINNEPYGIGLKVLKEKNPKHIEENRYGVIMIDPFPNKDHDVSESGKDILSIAKGLLRALRDQVMFNQEGILDALDLSDRTKFMIEPVRKIEVNGKWVRPKSDMASAPIAGFAGFLSRDFRAHDFQLGRKNCQAFLRYYFAVSSENIENRLNIIPNDVIKERFQFAVPAMDIKGEKFFPIIPDMRVLRNFNNQVDTAKYGVDAEIKALPFPKLSFTELEKQYKKKIKNRIGSIVKYLLKNRFLSFMANFFYIRSAGYKFVKETIKEELGENDLLK